MKRILVIAMSVAILALSATASFAQDVPELRGTWRGPTFLKLKTGYKEGKTAYVIDWQKGPLFSGTKFWFDVKGELQKEDFTGLFGDDRKLYFAEHTDGYTQGHLTGKQAMTLYYLENGATAKAILARLERIHITTGFVEIDKDGDAVVMHAEISNHYPLLADYIIKQADKNKDGKLTKKEWELWRDK